jgi:hypothetical protein
MILEHLRSKPSLDIEAQAAVGDGFARGVGKYPDMLHTHFAFVGLAGDPPHARVSIGWDDVEALILKFAERGHPDAVRLLRADKLAGAVEELAKSR